MLLLVAGGCAPPTTAPAADSGPPSPAAVQTIRVTPKPTTMVAEEHIAVTPPPGWSQFTDDHAHILGFEADDDEHSQILFAVWPTRRKAAWEVAWVATGYVDKYAAQCVRLDDDRTFGEPRDLVDCLFTDPEPFHKTLLAMDDGRRSVAVMMQVDGRPRGLLAREFSAFLDSFRWLPES